jgi:hypothetical protein
MRSTELKVPCYVVFSTPLLYRPSYYHNYICEKKNNLSHMTTEFERKYEYYILIKKDNKTD